MDGRKYKNQKNLFNKIKTIFGEKIVNPKNKIIIVLSKRKCWKIKQQ